MENEPVIYDSSQFESARFSTNLYPSQFLFFLLKSLNKTDIADIDKLIITKQSPDEIEEEKMYIIFRIGNDALKKDDFFGTYYRSPENVHHLSYKRLFNKRFADKDFLELAEVYDTSDSSEIGMLLKKQIKKVYTNFIKQPAEFDSYAEMFDSYFVKDDTSKSGQDFDNLTNRKLYSFYQQSKKTSFNPQLLQNLLREIFYINTEVSFSNQLMEYDYNPRNLGIGDQGYKLGAIVLDNIVKYKDIVAHIKHRFQDNESLDFKLKVDYIYKFNLTPDFLHSINLSIPIDIIEEKIGLIPIVNNTKENFVNYSCNGINVHFPSCIFAYTIQYTNSKIELLYKFQNHNNYIAATVAESEKIEIQRDLYYIIDSNEKLISQEDYINNAIIAHHTVSIKFFIADESIRIETQENVVVDIKQYYENSIARQLKAKIDNVLDLFLPVIYERKIEL